MSASGTVGRGATAVADASAPGEGGRAETVRRTPELDGLRGIAILMVVVWHYWALSVQNGSGFFARLAVGILGLSWSGVDLFFVLSGFLIGGILLDQREKENYFKVFYVRRICRIVPLYYCVIALFLLAASFGPAFVAKAPHLYDKSIPVWNYLSFTQNLPMAVRGDFGPGWLGVTWSLAVEEQFYLCLPFIIRFVPLRKLPALLGSFFLSAIVLRIIVSGYRPDSFVPPFVLMPCRADSLMLGVLCACLVRLPGFIQFLTSHTLRLYSVLGSLGAVIACMAFQEHQPGSVSMAIYGYSLLALFYACFLLIAISEKRGIVSFIARNAVLRWFGLIAYGVYLLHEPIHGLCRGLLLAPKQPAQNQGELAISALAFVLTTLIASLSWLYFEKKIVGFGHALKYQGRSLLAEARTRTAS